jgi:hypothetical protein
MKYRYRYRYIKKYLEISLSLSIFEFPVSHSLIYPLNLCMTALYLTVTNYDVKRGRARQTWHEISPVRLVVQRMRLRDMHIERDLGDVRMRVLPKEERRVF